MNTFTTTLNVPDTALTNDHTRASTLNDRRRRSPHVARVPDRNGGGNAVRRPPRLLPLLVAVTVACQLVAYQAFSSHASFSLHVSSNVTGLAEGGERAERTTTDVNRIRAGFGVVPHLERGASENDRPGVGRVLPHHTQSHPSRIVLVTSSEGLLHVLSMKKVGTGQSSLTKNDTRSMGRKRGDVRKTDHGWTNVPPDHSSGANAGQRMQRPYSNNLVGDHGPPQPTCVPMKEWQTLPRPNCNTVHEISFLENRATLLGTGGWRGAWMIPSASPGVDEEFVVKTMRMDKPFDESTTQRHAIDAILTERLTRSPHVVDLYGYCAQTALNERLLDNLEDHLKAVGQSSLVGNSTEGGDARVATYDSLTMTPMQKLDYAAQVARGVAELHDIDGEGGRNATAVYKDLKPKNVAISATGGGLKLCDFNDSKMLKWNTTSQRQCQFKGILWSPHYRSPEEIRQDFLTEKIDVYALGGLIYFLLVGEKPYHGMKRGAVMSAIRRGEKPDLPPNVVSSTNSAIVALKTAMIKCQTYNFEERPGAGAMATFLSDALKSLR